MISSGSISALRDLAAGARADITSVRGAFASGVPPLKTVNSGTVSDILGRPAAPSTKGLMDASLSFGISASPPGSITRPPQPELDRVEIDIDGSIGLIDSFFSAVVFSLATSVIPNGAVGTIFRADLGPIPGAPRPSASALGEMVPSKVSRKNIDQIAVSAFQGDRLGVGNKLTTIVVDDQQLGTRVVRPSGSQLPSTQSYRNGSRPSGPDGLISIANLDPSVATNPTFYINRRTVQGVIPPTIPLDTGGRTGIHVLGGNSVATAGGLLQTGNSAGYNQVGQVSLASGRIIGSFTEYSFIDPSVVHGNRYAYYVTCDVGNSRSIRSRIVSVDVLVAVTPESPVLSYTIVGSQPRFTLLVPSKSAVDHVEVFRRGGDIPDQVQILAVDGALVSSAPSVSVPSGFNHIGDLALGPDRSVSFVDTGVRPGQELDYRFYTVGSYGLKSQTPTTCSLLLSEFGIGVPLRTPSITAEQGVGSPKIRIRVECDDPRALAVLLGRRILSQGEELFHVPSAPAACSIGSSRGAKRAASRRGPTFLGTSPWSGLLVLSSGSAELDDASVEYDRVYQYSAVAVAGQGLESSAAISDVIRVVTRPVVEPPVNVTWEILSGNLGPHGIAVRWSGSTSDFSPSQLIGSQADIADSSVRTVYQLERRGSDGRWVALPATTETWDVDLISTASAPPFRPAYAQMLETYQYRVVAMQSGGFLSMRSDPIQVTVEPSVSPPAAAWVRATSTAVRPIGVVVSWDDPQGFVDRWQIERALVNKIYGSRITSVDSVTVRSLNYSAVGEVPVEASRALPVSASASFDPTIYVGSRFFVDSDVSLANSYFYRIRSVLPSGKESDWVYLGIQLSDSAFDRKLHSTLSDSDRVSLASDSRPIRSTGVE